MTRWNEHASGKDAEQLMRYVAYGEGLTFHEWCDKYGIVDNAGAVQIRRRELQMPSGNLDRPLHQNTPEMYQGGDTPPHYETNDWGPEQSALTPDNVFETERRQRGLWRRSPKK